MNKTIHRSSESSGRIFDNRRLETDYATLVSALTRGLRVLDVGCGTGSISRDIAERVGEEGHVTGIDNTAAFINSGRETYGSTRNLELVHADLFAFDPAEKFDLVVAARVLQWLSDPKQALEKLASLLKPGGQISILDYNHEALIWQPDPPPAMQLFYRAFLKWRSDAGMDNRIADHLPEYFRAAGLRSIEVFNADEVYRKGQPDFVQRVGIWSAVAGLKQIVEEGYLQEDARLQAIVEYDSWVAEEAQSMTMVLREVRGKI